MGTSGAYEGSGGSGWSGARGEAEQLMANAGSSIADALAAVALAVPWGGPDYTAQDTTGGSGHDSPPDAATPPSAPSLLLPLLRHPGPSGASSSSGGGGGSGGGSGGGGGRLRAASTRSRRRAASVGGRAISAGLAIAGGDAVGLADLGLDLTQLAALDPYEQCARVMEQLDGAATVEELEVRRAAVTTVLHVLELGTAATAVDAVRVFIGDYVLQVATTELGRTMRNGEGRGPRSATIERQMRDYIRAVVGGLDLTTATNSGVVPAGGIEAAIFVALSDVRDVFMAGGDT